MIDTFVQRMEAASAAQEYELAARFRDQVAKLMSTPAGREWVNRFGHMLGRFAIHFAGIPPHPSRPVSDRSTAASAGVVSMHLVVGSKPPGVPCRIEEALIGIEFHGQFDGFFHRFFGFAGQPDDEEADGFGFTVLCNDAVGLHPYFCVRRVLNRLSDGEKVVLINGDGAAEDQALAVVPGQHDRRFGGQPAEYRFQYN